MSLRAGVTKVFVFLVVLQCVLSYVVPLVGVLKLQSLMGSSFRAVIRAGRYDINRSIPGIMIHAPEHSGAGFPCDHVMRAASPPALAKVNGGQQPRRNFCLV